MNERDARTALCRLGAHLAARGLSPGTSGNLSLKLDDERLLMTPTNSSLGELDSGALSLLDAQGTQLAGAPATKEHFLHAAVYRARPQATAIVHLHSTYAVAYACLRGLDPSDAMPPITPYSVMRLGRVALVPYVRPGDPRLGDAVAAVAQTHHAILLANHGPVLAGPTLESAAAQAEELEETAKLLLLLRDGEVNLLRDADVEELRRTFPS